MSEANPHKMICSLSVFADSLSIRYRLARRTLSVLELLGLARSTISVLEPLGQFLFFFKCFCIHDIDVDFVYGFRF